MYKLPTALDDCEIRSKGDYRVVLNTIAAMQDNELLEDGPFGNERALLALEIFYENPKKITDIQKAIDNMLDFISAGQPPQTSKAEKLFDWQKDKMLIVGALSETAGFPIMEREYLHWWSFVAYFNQIGEGGFATVVSIRSKMMKNKRLEKWEDDFVKNNSCYFKRAKLLTENESKALDKLFDVVSF